MKKNSLTWNFSCNLKKYRKKFNLTQSQLGNIIGYTEKAIAKWESGTTLPSVMAIAEVAKNFEIKIDDLLVSPDRKYILGIDGGGTKTHYMLYSENEELINEFIGAGCNPFDVGVEKAYAIIKEGISNVLGEISPQAVTVFAGIAGCGNEEMKNALKNCFFNCKFKNFEIASDNENIIKIGLGEEEGISLILGTGVCLFEVKKNSRIRKSGWGYLIDEGGSAYNFGIDAMKTYFSYVDGYIPKTILHSKIEEKAGCMSTKLIENIYSEKKHYVASFAPLVFEAAEKYDDELAKSIIDKNMKLVAQLIDNALLDFDEEKGPVNCVISGGLTKQKKLIKYIQENLKDKTKVNIKVLDIPMVLGAVSMAKELHNKREGKSYV